MQVTIQLTRYYAHFCSNHSFKWRICISAYLLASLQGSDCILFYLRILTCSLWGFFSLEMRNLPCWLSFCCAFLVIMLKSLSTFPSTTSSRFSSKWSDYKAIVMFYLKRVIVTPAASRVLAPLKRGLKHRRWADFTYCTHPFGLAISYVFDKQLGHHGHCDLSTLDK